MQALAQASTPAQKVAAIIASGFGSGFSRYAPGSVGSLACLLLWYFLSVSGLRAGILFDSLALLLICLVGILTVRICLGFLAKSASNDGQNPDPQWIVIDEWAGLFFALTGTQHTQLAYVFLGFALFRLFDIIKPGPVSWLEQLPGEWGIMLDDLAAGFLAFCLLFVIQTWLH